MITASLNTLIFLINGASRLPRSLGRSPLVGITLVALPLLQSGCASITTPSGAVLSRSSPEFRDYASAVFRRQNAALVSIFDVYEDANDADIAELDRAEQAMIDSCAPLNRAASARRDGETLNINTLKRVAASVVDCDTATINTEQLIRRVQTTSGQS